MTWTTVVFHLLLGLERNQEALKEALLATQMQPGNALAQEALGTAFARLRAFTEAVAAFEKTLQMNPRDPGAVFIKLGAAHMETGNLEKALEAFNEAEKADPAKAETVRFYRCLLYRRAGKTEDAARERQGITRKELLKALDKDYGSYTQEGSIFADHKLEGPWGTELVPATRLSYITSYGGQTLISPLRDGEEEEGDPVADPD